MQRLFRFAYFSPPKHTNENPALHHLRDGDAALEIASVFLERKQYSYGGLLLNFPSRLRTGRERSHMVGTMTRPGPGDLILIIGRPPLDDFDTTKARPGRSRIDPSHTNLEIRIFTWLRSYFDTCTRREIHLSASVPLPLEDTHKRHLLFQQYWGATYKSARGPRSSASKISAAFLARTSEVWEGGPSALCVFGMAGPETLIWTYLLRTRFPEALWTKRFCFAEIHETAIDNTPEDLEFCDQWRVDWIVDMD